jgi:TRAP-type C4-dicarboxylate transport system substrate-binding protein
MLISQPTKHMKNSPRKPKPVSRKSSVSPSNLYLYLCLPRAVKPTADCHTPGDLIPSTSKEGGIVSFGIAEGGFAYVMSKKSISSIQDLTQQKVWAPTNDQTTLKAVGAFGITPIPLSLVDVRTGLQTGLIDTVATSPIGAIALQWHTQVNYLIELPLLYIYATMGVSQRDFEKLSQSDQAVTREVMGRILGKSTAKTAWTMSAP